MSVSSSRVWNQEAEGVDELMNLGVFGTWERRNRKRMVDLWAAWAIHAAARALHLGRYRDNHDLTEAIHELRATSTRVADLMRRDLVARKEQGR